MSIQVCDAAVLIQRVLLDVQARSIDMGSDDIESLFHALFTDSENSNRFVHPDAVDALSRKRLSAFADQCLQFGKAGLVKHVDRFGDTFAFRLSAVEEMHIFLCEFIAFLLHLQVIGCPCVQSFHVEI